MFNENATTPNAAGAQLVYRDGEWRGTIERDGRVLCVPLKGEADAVAWLGEHQTIEKG